MLMKTKKWGNSMGVILPKQMIEQLDLKLGDEINITVEKKSSVLKEMFGALKFSKPTKELLKESRENDKNMEF